MVAFFLEAAFFYAGGMDIFRKAVSSPDQAGAEAAGLRWLAQADERVVAEVVGVTGTSISTKRVRESRPSVAAARAFGEALCRVHQAGATAFGAPPEGWEGANFIGRVEQPCEPCERWGEFYAEQRIKPFLGGLPEEVSDSAFAAADAIAAVDWDVAPARIHGDLWAGNVLFQEDTAVMIDPAAHGGHPWTDLAMLELFGVPFYDEILRGYGVGQEYHQWVPMHQLHPLSVHALTHGSAYYAPLERAARATLEALR